MSFEKNFCSSPWIHARITSDGNFEYCRWISTGDHPTPYDNIKHIEPITWFQKNMASFRHSMLNGEFQPACNACRNTEQHGKISGRQKQLLKTGVTLVDFTKTMLSSPWMPEWQHSLSNHGHTQSMVQDWQIDLGNFCNSACLFCTPESSSRLATEHKNLGLINQLPPKSWCDDPILLARFIDAIKGAPNISYMHFIGGETLITPAFKKILNILIESSLHETVTLGFTTNLTVMDDETVSLLEQFSSVHLGISIECLDRVNDYVRYGSKISQAMQIMSQWLDIAKNNQWLTQLRTTPTVLTLSRLVTIYEYAWNNNLLVESCNFLNHPVFMKPSVLPAYLRQQIKNDLLDWVSSKSISTQDQQIVNIRNPDFLQHQLLQDATTYIRYLDNEPDRSDLLPDLVRYLKIMDKHRKNSVFDYLPEYEELFRSVGY